MFKNFSMRSKIYENEWFKTVEFGVNIATESKKMVILV